MKLFRRVFGRRLPREPQRQSSAESDENGRIRRSPSPHPIIGPRRSRSFGDEPDDSEPIRNKNSTGSATVKIKDSFLHERTDSTSLPPNSDKRNRHRRVSVDSRRSRTTRRLGRSQTTERRANLAVRLGLKTEEQQRALEYSWQKITDLRQPRGALTVMNRVLEGLSEKEALVKSMFLHTAFIKGMVESCGSSQMGGGVKTLRDHAKFLLWAINETVFNFDKKTDDVMNYLIDIGEKHSRLSILGFTNKHWDKFGQKFLEEVAKHEAVRKQPSALKAWTVFIAGIVDIISVGFQKRNRKDRLRTSMKKHSVAHL